VPKPNILKPKVKCHHFCVVVGGKSAVKTLVFLFQTTSKVGVE
jgi:hypothetical protein